MKELVLQVQESEYEFVLKLLRQLRFINVLEKPVSNAIPAEKMEVLESIKIALEEVKMIQNGQIPKKTLNEFLAELD